MVAAPQPRKSGVKGMRINAADRVRCEDR